MQSTGDALLQAIVEDPDADDLRLIYADWLDDHGDPAHAEFIRVQVGLAALDESELEAIRLRQREYELLADHAHHWLAGLWSLLGVRQQDDPDAVRFARGFPERLTLTADRFDDVAPLVRTRTPITALNLDTGLALAASPFAGRLHRLYLNDNQIGDVGLLALAGSPHLDGLRELHVSRNRNSHRCLRALWDRFGDRVTPNPPKE